MHRGPRYFWFRLSLVMGVLLGLLLLAQSIFSYVFVSRRVVRDQLRRETDRQITLLELYARQAQAFEPQQVAALMEELRNEAGKRIAWIRLVDREGSVLAQSGRPAGAPIKPSAIRAAMENRQTVSEVRDTPEGRVLVTVLPFRTPRAPPPQRPPASTAQPPRRPGLRFVEMALYLNSMGSGFGALQRGLVVSTSAAVALLGAMILLFVRLPEYLRAKQLEQQIAVARQVQQDLLSPVHRFSGNLEFAAACVPAFQVGGDFYDVYVSEGRIAMVLGDVSGKGLPAALLMGLVHGGIRCSTWVGSAAAHEAASVRLNELLHARTSVERFVSLFWGYYDSAAGTLSYVNAGHWPPLLVRAENPDGVCRLEEGGPVLGILPKAGYKQGTAVLHGGDVLVIYSDGVVEAADRDEREFGEERLRALVAANRTRPAPEIMDEILRQLRDFVGQAEVSDDVTLLVVRSTA